MREEIACPLNPLPFFAKKSNNILSSPLFLFSFDTFLRALLFFSLSSCSFLSFLRRGGERKKLRGGEKLVSSVLTRFQARGFDYSCLKRHDTHTHTHSLFQLFQPLLAFRNREREKETCLLPFRRTVNPALRFSPRPRP